MFFKQSSYKEIDPASGAIIMACGIFLFGTIDAFPVLAQFGKIFAMILLIVWVLIYKDLTIQFCHKAFLKPFLKSSTAFFTMGTWIAGVSMLCHVLIKYFPNMLRLTQIMAIINMTLWFFFFVICLYHFKQLLMRNKLTLNGTILLSTVGTQSIIILQSNVFHIPPIFVSRVIILLGLLCYLIGIWLIIKRYIFQQDWSLADDWSNTNCIIHGALSITGLAIVTTHTFTAVFTAYFWIVVLSLLVMIETIEVVRATQRIRLYGWRHGVFTYHVSQWSRNFTFGMFYTFTLVMQENQKKFLPLIFNNLQEIWMDIWAWVVLLLLFLEITLSIMTRFSKHNPLIFTE